MEDMEEDVNCPVYIYCSGYSKKNSGDIYSHASLVNLVSIVLICNLPVK